MKRRVLGFSEFVNENRPEDRFGLIEFTNSPEFQKMIERGYRFSSSPIQVKNGTLILCSNKTGRIIQFMGDSKIVRKEIERSIGGKRLIEMGKFSGIDQKSFWKEAYELVMTLDPETFQPEAAPNTEVNKKIIRDYVNSLGIPFEVADIIGKSITYNNAHAIASKIRQEISEFVEVSGNNTVTIHIKGRVRGTENLKVNYKTLYKMFGGHGWKVNIRKPYHLGDNLIEALEKFPNPDVIFTLFEAYSIKPIYQKSTESKIEVESFDEDRAYVSVELNENQGSVGKFRVSSKSTANRINVQYYDKPVPVKELVLDFDANEVEVLISQNGPRRSIFTNIDPSKIKIKYVDKNYVMTDVEYSNQVVISIYKLDGTPINPDHDTNIYLHDTINDIW
jgi:hypothetical protein